MATYNTKQREYILEYIIDNSNRHVSVDDIVYYLHNKNTRVGKTTVYRYLDLLIEEGRVRKYAGVPCACYQYVGEGHKCSEHYHFKCTKCDKLYHLKCNLLNEITNHVKEEHRFIVDNTKTVFYGVCEKCLKN